MVADFKHLNIDVGHVTITFLREEKERVATLLGVEDSARFYSGWITEENPSKNPIGFALWFDSDGRVYADFHNLPFYYRSRDGYQPYHDCIVSSVSKHPSFRSWAGQASRFNPSELPLFVDLLNDLAESLPRRTRVSSRHRPGPGDVVYAPPPRPRIDTSKVPEDLRNLLDELGEWASANSRDARRDTVAFWMLKLPAIVASAGAGVWAHFELPSISVVCGAIASVCVIVDGILPRGMLRNTHLRAHHDIRSLMNHITAAWRTIDPSNDAAAELRQIIRDTEKERQRITKYVRDAETALKDKYEEA